MIYISIKSKITESEKELLEIAKEVKEFKKGCEANIVSILWKNPDLFYIYDNLKLDDFSENCWKVFWTIGNDMIVRENKKTLDEITVGLYLEEHKKLKEKYNEYGGHTTIENAKTYVSEDNLDGYIKKLQKWNVVLQLIKNKFPLSKSRIKDFVDMSAEEIYDEYEAILNHVFVSVEHEDKSCDIADNIVELIDELDEGLAVGLPLIPSPILNNEIGGNLVGNITMVGGLSGAGKTTFSRNLLLPSILDKNEKIIIMLNEEGVKKWQREYLIWVANNIFHTDLKKYVVRNGKYSEEIKSLLLKCAEWIKSNKERIFIIPFKTYSTSKAIKIIKKYSSMGVKYFVLDTFKADEAALNDNAFWLNMQNNMVKIHDVIKAENKNVHIWITFQLSKNSSKQRFFCQDNIGMAKNSIDTASTCLMIRNLFEDEYEGGKNELKVFRKEGKSEIPVKLKEGHHYQVVFIIKNREGSSNEYQIVVEHDLSKNTYREIGFCSISVDW